MDLHDADSYLLYNNNKLKLMQPKTGQRWAKQMPSLVTMVAGNDGLEPIDNNQDVNRINLQLFVAAFPKLANMIPPGLQYTHVTIVFADFSYQDVTNLTKLLNTGLTPKGDYKTIVDYRNLFTEYGHEMYGSDYMTINATKKKKMLPCPHDGCMKEFENKSRLLNHLSLSHKFSSSLNIGFDYKEEGNGNGFQCLHCDVNTKSQNGIIAHLGGFHKLAMRVIGEEKTNFEENNNVEKIEVVPDLDLYFEHKERTNADAKKRKIKRKITSKSGFEPPKKKDREWIPLFTKDPNEKISILSQPRKVDNAKVKGKLTTILTVEEKKVEEFADIHEILDSDDDTAHDSCSNILTATKSPDGEISTTPHLVEKTLETSPPVAETIVAHDDELIPRTSVTDASAIPPPVAETIVAHKKERNETKNDAANQNKIVRDMDKVSDEEQDKCSQVKGITKTLVEKTIVAKNDELTTGTSVAEISVTPPPVAEIIVARNDEQNEAENNAANQNKFVRDMDKVSDEEQDKCSQVKGISATLVQKTIVAKNDELPPGIAGADTPVPSPQVAGTSVTPPPVAETIVARNDEQNKIVKEVNKVNNEKQDKCSQSKGTTATPFDTTIVAKKDKLTPGSPVLDTSLTLPTVAETSVTPPPIVKTTLAHNHEQNEAKNNAANQNKIAKNVDKVNYKEEDKCSQIKKNTATPVKKIIGAKNDELPPGIAGADTPVPSPQVAGTSVTSPPVAENIVPHKDKLNKSMNDANHINIVKNADKDQNQPSQIKRTTVAPAEKKTIAFEKNYKEEELNDLNNVDMHHTIDKNAVEKRVSVAEGKNWGQEKDIPEKLKKLLSLGSISFKRI